MTGASRCGPATIARGRCTARSACRRRRGRASTSTTRPTRLTRWPTASGPRRSSLGWPDDGTSRYGRGVLGGVMQLESMYQEIILDHYRHPHHRGLREPFDAQVHHVNPTCGDEVTLRVTLKDAGSEPVVA